MDPDLARFLRAVSRALPILLPIAILVLPAILRAMAQKRVGGTGSGPGPTSAAPPGSAEPTGPQAEDDLVAQVRRMLEQRQGLPTAPPPVRPAPAPAPRPVRPPRSPETSREDEIEARGVAHRGDPPAPPRRQRTRPVSGQDRADARRSQSRAARPATVFAEPAAARLSAAEQKEQKAAATAGKAEAPPVPAAAAPALPVPVLTGGRGLAEAIARNPLAALMAAEVLGPCRAAAELGEGPTSPIGLRAG